MNPPLHVLKWLWCAWQDFAGNQQDPSAEELYEFYVAFLKGDHTSAHVDQADARVQTMLQPNSAVEGQAVQMGCIAELVKFRQGSGLSRPAKNALMWLVLQAIGLSDSKAGDASIQIGDGS